MSLLLDTQVILWYLDKNPRLGRESVATIQNASSVSVSAISIFEVAIKSILGKLDAPADFYRVLQTKGFRVAAFDGSSADEVRQFPELTRHDPFDRMLLAQAQAEGLTLLTADQVLLGLNLPSVLDARL